MRGVKVKYVNPEILKELASLKPDAYNRMREKYPKIEKWLSGEDYPTYNQLIELSKIFNVPFGYFFFKELPKYEMPIPHYRTIEKNHFKPSEELLDTIKFAQRVQDWAKDILLELGNDKIDFCGKYKSNLDLNAIVDELKAIFDVKEGWAKSKRTWKDAFRYLVDKAEEKGIIVLINGVVGNNTHRKLNVNEFRGFVLYDEIAPVVFINNEDALSGKIFTLIHEVVHLLIGKSASFDYENLQPADNEIEKFCDKCAAEFLVPTKELLEAHRQIKNYDKYATHHNSATLQELAKHFKVSQIVIARRLYDLNLINKNEFIEFLQETQKKEYNKPVSRGGNFYETAKLRLSQRFLSLLKSAIYDNLITYKDALLITDLKAKSFFELIGENT
jgi:Predicted Zn peptidase